MKFELEDWGDGTIRLVHWDSLHGDDVIIELSKGAAYRGTYDENDNEVSIEVNLVPFLVDLLKERRQALAEDARATMWAV